MKRFILAVAVLLSAVALAAQKRPTLYHTFRLSEGEVGINCVNGGVPQAHTVGNLIIVECAQ